MSLWETFTLAVKNISGSKMRTFLTMLGIIIGVCAVIVIVGLGNGMAGYMEDSFAEMGTNTLTVSIMGRGTSRTVSEEQMYQIVEDNAGYLDQISPTVSMTGSVKIGSTTYSSTSVSGVGETWFDMKGYEVAQGRGIEYMDIVNRKKVCVVGNYVAQTCFGGNAVGQSLKVGGTTFSIVGVMAQEAEQMEEGGTDDCVYVPYSTAARLSFTGTISSYTVTVTDEEYATLGKEAIETALYKIFQDEDAYTVVSMAEMLDTMTSGGLDEVIADHHPGGHRRHLSAGGRHWHYEHHAGLCHRAHPGDRYPQGPGGQGGHHPAAVCDRSRHHLRPWRRAGHHPWLSHVGGCYTGHQTADGDGHYRLSLGHGGLGSLWDLRRHRHPVWLSARKKSRPPRSHRSPAV